MKPTLPPLKRCLPPLLILACLAMAGCGTADGGSGGAAPPGASDATAVKSGSTTRAEAAPGDQAGARGPGAGVGGGCAAVPGEHRDRA